MAKLSFTKLGLKPNQDIKTIEFNNQVIEIKEYVSIQTKLQMISNVINSSLSEDTEGFYNPVKLEVFLALEIVENYTNIGFTDKQKEDIVKLYDLLEGNGLLDMIYQAIGDTEITELQSRTKSCVKAISDYESSVLGILNKISDNYNSVNLDVDALREKVANTENIELVKDIVSKLG